MTTYGKLCDDLDRAAVSYVLSERKHAEASAEMKRIIASPPGEVHDSEIAVARAMLRVSKEKLDEADAAWKALARALTTTLEQRGFHNANGVPQ